VIKGTAILVLVSIVASGAHAAVGRTETLQQISTSGEAQYSIPIFTPHGTGSVQPKLSISYGHRFSGQLLGVGWRLSGLSAIARCPRTWAQDGAPRNVRNDMDDRFCLNGNKLRLVAGVYGQPNAEYRTEIETFARIRSFGVAGNGPESFVVESKDGLIHEYGTTQDSRIESLGQSSVREWALSRVRDRAGNTAEFSYFEDTTYGSYRITSIAYTSNPSQGLAASVAVTFQYESKPSNEIDSEFLAGSLIREVTRLKRVDVVHSSTLVRRYELSYEASLSSTGRSRLASIQECAGTTGTDCFLPTTFTYQNGTVGVTAQQNSGAAMPSGTTPWAIDVNGDGRDDLVYSSSSVSGSGHWMVLFANSGGGYGSPINTGIVNLNFFGAIPIDYNADGKQDLLVPYSGGTWWVMLGGAGGLSAPVNTGAPATGVGINAVAADIDGDGLEDLVWADVSGFSAPGDAIRYRRREWGGAFSATAVDLVGPMPQDWFVNPGLGGDYGPRAKKRLPDFNGDGRADLFFATTWSYYDPEFGQTVTMNYWNFLCTGGGCAESIAVAPAMPKPVFPDLNGDGRSDLLYANSASSAFYIRFGTGTSFTAEYAAGAATGYDTGQIVIVDWDGDDYEDVLIRNTSSGTWHLFRSNGTAIQLPVNTGLTAGSGWIGTSVADINGDGMYEMGHVSGGTWRYYLRAGVPADLLVQATDGFGNTAGFAYAPLSGANHSKDADAVFPSQDYAGSLHVVSSLAASDGIGGTYVHSIALATT